MRFKHPAEFRCEPSPVKQTSLDCYVSAPKKMTGSESESITNAIVGMVVKDYVPLSILEAEGFRNLMKTATPNYSMPSRNTNRARINK
ncbi:hypothetical protein DPMN_008152 [Dreissena polymorpha]|uniref:Uncharacterized protein n=1 Tax=Dreissena polymorpha TaxID=45954 RepID=A0A9D4MYN5_DREPO|nr:hypothetical protein DPMN_008152 [Dreissena polymorpha]